ncbi:MAG: DUF929 family protein [Acidimicrobiales bacterium]
MAKSPASKRSPVPAKGATRNPGRSATKGPAKSGRPAGLFTWIAVGLVVVIVVALVIIKVSTGSPTSSGSSGFQTTSPTVVSELSHVPTSVFNTVGVTSPVAQVVAPVALKDQPALTGTSTSGATLPEVFYLGAEFCPYCAAERWPAIIALSRFGTFSHLGNMTSTSSDYLGTPTFTFLKATYKSKYLVFKSVEASSNIYDNAINFWAPLQKVTASERALMTKYQSSKYISGWTSQDNGSIPFITIDNKFLVTGAQYTPSTLANQSRDDIAAGLSSASSPITQAIITASNEWTAALCVATNGQPSNVCASSGVSAAKKVMGIT